MQFLAANSNSAVDESFEAISFDQLDPDDSMILTPVIEVRPITFRFDSSHDSPSTSRQGTITFQHSSYKQIFNKPVPNSADQAQNISEVCPSTSEESSRRLKESSSSKSSEENEAALDEDKLTSSDEVKTNKNFKDFFTNLEYEILCSICSEYLIKATTLMCSHTFCAFCIRKWQKTRRNCPMCNARIDLKMYTLTLDRIIERVRIYSTINFL